LKNGGQKKEVQTGEKHGVKPKGSDDKKTTGLRSGKKNKKYLLSGLKKKGWWGGCSRSNAGSNIHPEGSGGGRSPRKGGVTSMNSSIVVTKKGNETWTFTDA